MCIILLCYNIGNNYNGVAWWFIQASLIDIPVVLTIFELLITISLIRNKKDILVNTKDKNILIPYEIVSLIIMMIGEFIVTSILFYPTGQFLSSKAPSDSIIFIILMFLFLSSLIATNLVKSKKRIWLVFMVLAVIESILTMYVPMILNILKFNKLEIDSLFRYLIWIFPFVPINLVLITLRTNFLFKNNYEIN